jgi:protein AbiQ
MKYIFLTDQFYIDYAHCAEIEKKAERPYVQVYINVNNLEFAIPLRSNLSHNNVFWTDKPNRCGIDYSKAVIIEDTKYIDTTLKPYIRQAEFKALLGKERDVVRGLLDYIEKYKAARINPSKHDEMFFLPFSTMQYFEKYIIQDSGY